MAWRCASLVLAALWLWGGVSCLRIQYSPLDTRDPLIFLIASALSPLSVRVSSVQKLSECQGGFTYPLDDLDLMGYSASTIGDLDGDGILEFGLGAWGDDDGGMNRGAIYILFMNADGTIRLVQKVSSTQGGASPILANGDSFGAGVCDGGDLDGDGVNDLAVGAVGDDDGGTDRGAAYVLFLERFRL